MKRFEAKAILAVREQDYSVLNKYFEQGGDPDLQDANGWSLLCVAASIGDKHLVEYLISEGSNVNFRPSEWHVTPLYCAAYGSNPEVIIDILITSGADTQIYVLTPADDFKQETVRLSSLL